MMSTVAVLLFFLTFINVFPVEIVYNDALNQRVEVVLGEASQANSAFLIGGSADKVGEGRDGLGVSDHTLYVLGDVVKAKLCPDAVVIHVL